MAKAAKETPLARRLRELAQEEKALRQHIKTVSRQAQKRSGGVFEEGPEPRVESYAAPDETGLPAAAPIAEPTDGESGDLDRPAKRGEPATGQDRPVSPGYAATVQPNRRRPAANPERFVTYFASGSFGKARPLGHEKRLQRNKAIFMVIFVLLVGFLLYRFFF